MTTDRFLYLTKVTWFAIRSHLTKLMGVIGVVIGYALQTQAQWVQWLADKPRGEATKALGIAVVLLGLYNQLFPPQKPTNPNLPSTPPEPPPP